MADVTRWIIGSKLKPNQGGEPVHIFDMSTGMGEWIYLLVTGSRSQARSARSKGYDCVVYHGPGIVGGVPEIAVFDPDNARIMGVEVV